MNFVIVDQLLISCGFRVLLFNILWWRLLALEVLILIDVITMLLLGPFD